MTTQPNPPEDFDTQFTTILHQISQGPELINSFLIEDIINLVYDHPTCLSNLVYRLSEFIDNAPPNYLLSTLYIIDALIRYPPDEFCLSIEHHTMAKIAEVVTRLCNCPQEIKEKVSSLLTHWQRNRAFSDEFIGKCKDIIRNSEVPRDPNVVQIKTNVILLTQLPSDWNEYRIKEAANDVAEVLRVTLKAERHYAFIVTATRSDAEKLKSVLERKMSEVKSNFVPKVVWATEQWMKSFVFEDVEGIVYIERDKIPPTIVVNEDGTYITERIPRGVSGREGSYRSNRFGSTGNANRQGSTRERSSSRH